MTHPRRSRSSTCVLSVSAALLLVTFTGCRIDEVTFGVGDAHTEDAFGNPVARPFDEGESLRLYRYEVKREDPEAENRSAEEQATEQNPVPED